MLYLLLILFPLVMAAACFILRKQAGLTIALGVATAAVQMALLSALPIDDLARLFGLNITLDALSRLFLLLFLAVSAISFLVTAQIAHGEHFIPVTLVTLSLIHAVLLLQQEPFTVALLLVTAGVIVVLAIVDLPTGSSGLVRRPVIATALKYLVLMAVAGVVMYMGFVLISIYEPGEAPGRVSPAQLTLALMVVGFGLRLAIVPFHSWLPDLAENAAPMVSVLVVAIINTASMLFLIQAWQIFPNVVFENEAGFKLLRIVGAGTAVIAAFLALSQTSMRRLIGLLLVYNAGNLLFGLASGSAQGITGALFEALNQVLAVAVLFISIGLLERPDGRASNVQRHDLLWRWPVASIGLLGGGLTLLGLPPMSGFVGKMMLYDAAARHSWMFVLALLLATALATLALVRLARERLCGPAEDRPEEQHPALLGATDLDYPAQRRLAPEPRLLAALTIGLLAVSVAVCVRPQLLLMTIDTLVRDMPFLKG
jgi:formate hydrogenlyase subunit 3/multisubunit Na+/H+ antiporter MnhD subunit